MDSVSQLQKSRVQELGSRLSSEDHGLLFPRTRFSAPHDSSQPVAIPTPGHLPLLTSLAPGTHMIQKNTWAYEARVVAAALLFTLQVETQILFLSFY